MADPRVRENIGKVALMTEGTVTIEGQTFPTIIAKGKKSTPNVRKILTFEVHFLDSLSIQHRHANAKTDHTTNRQYHQRHHVILRLLHAVNQ